MTENLAEILTELRHRLETLYGPRLERLILYGSQARDDAEPGSDYDIGPGLTKAQAIEQIARAEQFLELAERLIGPIPPP